MTEFFTADWHLFHNNIRLPNYCNRPFSSVEEMNEAILANHNAIVKPEDEVYILGDVAFSKAATVERVKWMLSRFNGKLHLIQGNHDKVALQCRNMFQWIKPLHELSIPDPDGHHGSQLVVLCHYAMRTWNKSHWGTYHLYGHSHGSLAEDPNSFSFDVGVDCWDFKPVNYEQVKQKMLKKKVNIKCTRS